jgi:beta-phosphoglucomutase-like phosphatase (HAD superfamily)
MITDQNKVLTIIKSYEGEFAEVKNPAYVYPPVEYYPLANRIKKVNQLRAVLMDMDGTTTSTEVLCIHSLEMMVRRMSGLLKKTQWKGVDHHKDLPYIIGNSTTRHVEYLLNKYEDLLQPGLIATEFLYAARWTLHHGMDMQRKSEVVQNLKKLELSGALDDIMNHAEQDELIEKWAARIANLDFNTKVNLGIDIYYETYHRILALLKEGQAAEVRRQVFGEAATDENLISPMPGIPVLIPLLKGWLGEEAGQLAELLISDYEKSTGHTLDEVQKTAFSKTLVELGVLFAGQPVKIGLVTSSIFYEADIVIREVYGVMSRVIEQSNLSENRKEIILAAYRDYNRVYDAFVTATDSSEIRLKPHRDLYSIALHKTGLMPADFDKVIGFEDSESGTIAIRAAGIGCCVAVPFAQTLSHNLEAAAHILPGGVPEALFGCGLFLNEHGG